MLPHLLAVLAAIHPGPSAPAPASMFRVLEWNVSNRAWMEHRAESRAVLRAADPDVVVLVQVAGGTSEEEIRGMLEGLRGPADTTWFVSSRTDGDYERTVIAGRDSVHALAEFDHVTYPDTGQVMRRITPPPNESASPKDTVSVIRTNGALVRAAGRWVLVVGMHLTCCGTRDGWRETRRRLAAAVVRNRIRSALTRVHVAGVVTAGDMNLVGGRAPLDTLLTAIHDAILGPLRRADAVQADGWTDWTWDGRGTPFNGGRLDNVTYSTGSLSLVRARIWNTDIMSADTLRAYGLKPETSKTIGRHRPVVADLRFDP